MYIRRDSEQRPPTPTHTLTLASNAQILPRSTIWRDARIDQSFPQVPFSLILQHSVLNFCLYGAYIFVDEYQTVEARDQCCKLQRLIFPRSFLGQNDRSKLESIWQFVLQLTGSRRSASPCHFPDTLHYHGILNDPKRQKARRTPLSRETPSITAICTPQHRRQSEMNGSLYKIKFTQLLDPMPDIA